MGSTHMCNKSWKRQAGHYAQMRPPPKTKRSTMRAQVYGNLYTAQEQKANTEFRSWALETDAELEFSLK